ncbi:hypothetical protein T08_12463 [Trichinella sp. T8]|nr:hypothetical protein T08_12463 [Trichinella sp. T8]
MFLSLHLRLVKSVSTDLSCLVSRSKTNVARIAVRNRRGRKLKLPYEELDMKIGGRVRCGCLHVYGRVGKLPGKRFFGISSSSESARQKGKLRERRLIPVYNLVEEADEPARGSGPLHKRQRFCR